MNKKILLCTAILLMGVGMAAASFFDVSNKEQVNISAFGPSSQFKVRGKGIDVTLKAGKDQWQGVILTPPSEKFFDLSGGSVVAVDVRNLNRFPMQLNLEIVNLRDGKPNEFTHISPGAIALLPGEKATMRVRYGRAAKIVDWKPQGMQTNFDGFGDAANNRFNIIPEKVAQFRIWSTAGKEDMKFELSDFRLEDPPKPLPAALDSKEAFYPFIDQFGQYKHIDWENKIKNAEDLKIQKDKEDADLAANPGPRGRTRFGGWADGPTFKDRIGRWSTLKYKGKWFFTDPEGKLFWSLGMNSVEARDACDPTGISYRENYFEKLPGEGELGVECFSDRSFPRFGFYKGKGGNNDRNIKQFFFHKYNMLLKYGPDYYQEFMTRSQTRLKSWGFNTNGNWLEPDILKQEEYLPYMTCITFKTFYQVIEGCKLIGWQKFPDVFTPEFAKGLEDNLLSTHKDSIDDEFCIGYFMDNELSWGNSDTFLAEGTLRSGAQQPAKQAMTEMFRKKYSDISALNKAWGTGYQSWEDFCATTSVPEDMKKAATDLMNFNDYLVNTYFKVCKEVINRVAPGKLYFGCRFNDWNEKVIRTAAKYMDACSFNRYSPEVGRFALPEGVDMPVIIGEWHFGTVTNGPSHPGLQAAANQKERARAYDRYVRSALWNPVIVGVHYFKYCDQAATGRPADDENIQCGFIDICDTPYTDIVEASRKVGQDMYEYRVRTNNQDK